MPNHCDCDLAITGPRVEIEEYFRLYGGPQQGEPDCDKIIPYPEKFKEIDKAADKMRVRLNMMGDQERADYIKARGYPTDGFNSGGYQWCVENWGTKWGTYNSCCPSGFASNPIQDLKTRSKFAVSFQTAWGPPTPVIAKLSELMPRLRISLRFYERGCAFQGTLAVKNGKILIQTNRSYSGNRGG